MKHSYDRRYFPPAPVIPVWLVSPELQLSIGPFNALADTGTDVSAVPIHLLEQIQAPLVRTAFVRAHWGERLPVSLFTVDIQVEDWTLPAMEVIGDEREDLVILGRDVLNKLQLLLDGPAETTEVMPGKSRPKHSGRK